MKLYFLLLLLSFYSCNSEFPKQVTLNGEIFQLAKNINIKTDGLYDAQAYANRKQDILMLIQSDKGDNFPEQFFPRVKLYTKSQGYELEVEDKFVLGVSEKGNTYLTYNNKYIVQLTRLFVNHDTKNKDEEVPSKIADVYDLFDSMVLIKND